VFEVVQRVAKFFTLPIIGHNSCDSGIKCGYTVGYM